MSGESLDLLKVFFNILPPLSNSKEQEELMQQLTEFQVQFTLILKKWEVRHIVKPLKFIFGVIFYIASLLISIQ